MAFKIRRAESFMYDTDMKAEERVQNLRLEYTVYVAPMIKIIHM